MSLFGRYSMPGIAALGFGLSCLGACSASAELPAELEPRAQARLERSLKALESGAVNRAVEELEASADDGFQHPDISFNRGVAYTRRAQSSAQRPGDLGHAAAGFAEALSLRPGDTEAAAALAKVRAHIAQRRARAGGEPVMVNPPLGRTILGLVGEDAWSIMAALGSLALSAGLVLRRRLQRAYRLAAGVSVGLGVCLLLLGSAATLSARWLRLNWRPAVVVAPQARLLGPQGRAKDTTPGAVPEGETLYVAERNGSLLYVEWGGTRGWVVKTQLRLLARAGAD